MLTSYLKLNKLNKFLKKASNVPLHHESDMLYYDHRYTLIRLGLYRIESGFTTAALYFAIFVTCFL